MRNRQILYIGILLLSLGLNAIAQVNGAPVFSRDKLTTAPLDTNKLLSDEPLKSPTGAMLRSAVIPGWGQYYCENRLKGVALFAVNAFLYSRVYSYHKKWRDTGNRDYQNKRNTFTWYSALAYLLTIADAYVDASLYKFDEAMKITSLENFGENRWGIGVSFAWQF